jgi:hypothetical protein
MAVLLKPFIGDSSMYKKINGSVVSAKHGTGGCPHWVLKLLKMHPHSYFFQ